MVCFRLAGIAVLLVATCASIGARANEPQPITVIIRNHRFVPSEIAIAAGTDVVLDLRNEDASAEEFDMGALSFREVVFGRGSGIVRLRDVEAGRYPFFGDYHSGTAHGVLVAE